MPSGGVGVELAVLVFAVGVVVLGARVLVVAVAVLVLATFAESDVNHQTAMAPAARSTKSKGIRIASDEGFVGWADGAGKGGGRSCGAASYGGRCWVGNRG